MPQPPRHLDTAFLAASDLHRFNEDLVGADIFDALDSVLPVLPRLAQAGPRAGKRRLPGKQAVEHVDLAEVEDGVVVVAARHEVELAPIEGRVPGFDCVDARERHSQ